MNLSAETFRLTAYFTDSENKYNADHDLGRIEVLGSSESIFKLWFELSKQTQHVEVFNLNGLQINMSKGLAEMRSQGTCL